MLESWLVGSKPWIQAWEGALLIFWFWNVVRARPEGCTWLFRVIPFRLVESLNRWSKKLEPLWYFWCFKARLAPWIIVGTWTWDIFVLVVFFEQINFISHVRYWSGRSTRSRFLLAVCLHKLRFWMGIIKKRHLGSPWHPNSSRCRSLNSRLEYTCHSIGSRRFRFGKYIIISRSRKLLHCFTLSIWDQGRFLPSNNPNWIFADNIGRMVNIVVSWPYAIFSFSCEAELVWLLLDKLSFFIFFVAENSLVAGNGGRVHNLRTWHFIHLGS